MLADDGLRPTRGDPDDDGHLVTDIYSTSENSYWMAGRDVFVPVTTSAGEFVGMLVARWRR